MVIQINKKIVEYSIKKDEPVVPVEATKNER